MSNESLDKAKSNSGTDKALQELLKIPENQLCADCGAKGPRWASYNLGVFLCIRCGGLHRRIGTHVTKIKSITLDTWTPDQIAVMKEWGNAKANAHYIPNPELYMIPTISESDMEQYIREKYEKKAFMNAITCKSKFKVGSVSAEQPNLENKYNLELWRLKDMGFINVEMCLYALQKANGSIQTASEWLKSQPGARRASDLSVQGGAQQKQTQPQPQQSAQQDFFALISGQQPQQPAQQHAPRLSQPNAFDLFNVQSQQPSQPQQQQQPPLQQQQVQPTYHKPAEIDLFGSVAPLQAGQQQQQVKKSQDLFDLMGSAPVQQPPAQQQQQKQLVFGDQFGDLNAAFNEPAGKSGKTTKDILSLYNQAPQQRPGAFQQAPFQQQQQNPFGVPVQQANPFAQSSYGVASQQQQFGAASFVPRAAPQANPFGQQTAPFGQQQPGFGQAPFGQQQQQANPFGQVSAQPQNGFSANPFGAPFGQPQQNPFQGFF